MQKYITWNDWESHFCEILARKINDLFFVVISNVFNQFVSVRDFLVKVTKHLFHRLNLLSLLSLASYKSEWESTSFLCEISRRKSYRLDAVSRRYLGKVKPLILLRSNLLPLYRITSMAVRFPPPEMPHGDLNGAYIIFSSFLCLGTESIALFSNILKLH